MSILPIFHTTNGPITSPRGRSRLSGPVSRTCHPGVVLDNDIATQRKIETALHQGLTTREPGLSEVSFGQKLRIDRWSM